MSSRQRVSNIRQRNRAQRTYMGVYTRPDSKYYWLLLERDGEKPIRRATRILHSPATAKQKADNARLADIRYHDEMRAFAKGELGFDDAYTKGFDDLAAWYRTHRLPKRRGADRERDLLKHLETFFTDRQLRTFTYARVDEYETHRLSEKAGPATINREVDLLKSMLRIAAENKWCPPKLIHGKKRLHVPKRAKARLTPAQEAAILEAIPHANDRALLIMGMDTLARKGDLLDFQHAHDHGTTADIVDPKNGEFLSVPISPRLRAALDCCAWAIDRSPYYFWNRRVAKKERDWLGSVRLMLKGACERAGVPYGRKLQAITFHSATRRTGASRMLARGADLETVRSIGGWKDLRSMKSYVVAEDENRQRAVALVSNPITPQSRRNKIKRTIT